MSTEGNPVPASAAPVPTQVIPPGSIPTAVSPPMVNVLLDDVQRWRSQAAEFEQFKAAQARDLAAKEQERLNALAESGKWKQSLDETRASYDKQLGESQLRYSQLEQTVYAKETRTTLAQALTGRAFVGKTPEDQSAVASQLIGILEPQFETSRSADGGFVVRHKVTGRPATDVLKEALSSPAYAHFFSAETRGGSGTDATRSPGNPQQTSGLDALERDFFARQGQWAGIGLGGTAGHRTGG